MQDLLLLIALITTFICGWFLMARVDKFLERNNQYLNAKQNTLDVGFSNLIAANCVVSILKQQTEVQSELLIRFFCGDEEKMIKQLLSGKLDAIFLSKSAVIPDDMHYNSKEVLLDDKDVGMEYEELHIELLGKHHIMQNVIWLNESKTLDIRYLIACIGNEVT